MTVYNPFDDPEIAGKYERWYHTSGKQAAHLEKQLLGSFLEKFPGINTILDIGCGTGYFTNWYQKMGYQAYGLDRSFMMLKHGKRYENQPCCLGDAVALPFPDHSFDLVSYVTSLEFFPDVKAALREGLRVARQGMLVGAINRQSLLGLKYRKKGGPIWGHARLFALGELKQMLEEILGTPFMMQSKTTLWPLFIKSSKLPWGGFLVLAVMDIR
jgi:ubiquinone/menaquinone biosynthesis C-methylase UbiE